MDEVKTTSDSTVDEVEQRLIALWVGWSRTACDSTVYEIELLSLKMGH